MPQILFFNFNEFYSFSLTWDLLTYHADFIHASHTRREGNTSCYSARYHQFVRTNEGIPWQYKYLDMTGKKSRRTGKMISSRKRRYLDDIETSITGHRPKRWRSLYSGATGSWHLKSRSVTILTHGISRHMVAFSWYIPATVASSSQTNKTAILGTGRDPCVYKVDPKLEDL